MKLKEEAKNKLYGGYVGITTDKMDFEILKILLNDDNKKTVAGFPATELEWPFGAVKAVIAVDTSGTVIALKEDEAETYELIEYADAIVDDKPKTLEAVTREVDEMPDLTVVNVSPSKVDGDIKQFVSACQQYLKRYDGIVVNKDNYKDMTGIISQLKKESRDVNEKKKKVKKEAMKGYLEFEKSMKEVLDMFDKTIGAIQRDVQIFADEDLKKNQEAVAALVNKALADYTSRNDFDKYFAEYVFVKNDKWSSLKKFINNYKPTKALIDDIKQECERVKKEYEVYLQKCKSLDIFLEAKSKENNIDQSMFDAELYKRLLRNHPLEEVQKDIEDRTAMIKRKEEQKKEAEKNKEEKLRVRHVYLEYELKRLPEQFQNKECPFNYIAEFSGSYEALNEFNAALKAIKEKYNDNFSYTINKSMKEGK